MPAILIQYTFDAKMLLDIPFSINSVRNDQLALNLADTCLDNTLQVSRESPLSNL